MSNINYQELRLKAELATCGAWSLEYGEDSFDRDNALILRESEGYLPICKIEGAHPESGFDEAFQNEQQNNAEFIAAANPATVLALLDELEAAEKRIAELSHHLQSAHAFIEHTEAFGYEASNGILCCGDAQWNIDASKSALVAAGKGEAS